MSSPLISAAELRTRLDDVVVVDVRFKMGAPMGPDEYAAGHLPGASYVDLERDLAAPAGPGGRHPLPAASDFERSMRAAGVDHDSPVVVYDDWSGLAAGRCWWLLRYHGHHDVRLLDGALGAWRTLGGPLERGSTVRPEGNFTARPGQMPVVDADGVADYEVLVDARTPDRYRGEFEPQDPVAGRIPGAVNVPVTDHLTQEGHFVDLDTLRELYAGAGVLPVGRTVAAYCGSGVTATLDVLALEMLGVSAALYPGSWSGWSADPERPVETG